MPSSRPRPPPPSARSGGKSAGIASWSAQRGWSYDLIAGAENLTPRRIRQIVRQSLRLRQIDPAGAHVRLQTARLDASLRLAADRIEDGEPGAIDRLLRVLDRLDRCRNAAAPSLDEAAEGAAKFEAEPTISWRRPPRTRRGPRRAGGRTAAPPGPRVGATPEALPLSTSKRRSPAIAGVGSFGAPLGLAPTRAAARAFERPETAGAAGPQ
jgi:hypothetical protein